MFIYKLTQEKQSGYDTYDSIVVYAESEEEAKTINPDQNEPELKILSEEEWGKLSEEEQDGDYWIMDRIWTYTNYIQAELIGENKTQKEKGLILASFNA